MTQKQNGVLEWLQSCETPAPSEPKIKAVIVAGKSYMNSSEFNKNSMRDIILNQLQFLPLSFWIVQNNTNYMCSIISMYPGPMEGSILLSIDNPCSYGSIPCVIRCNRNI
mgnify:CR=1 FL=1